MSRSILNTVNGTWVFAVTLAFAALNSQAAPANTVAKVAVPNSQAQHAARYDASAVQQSYVALAGGLYSNALGTASALTKAIEALGNAPDAKALDAARSAWTSARTSYLATAAFRFYGGPIDGPKGANRAAGPELVINNNFRTIETALWGKDRRTGLPKAATELHSDLAFVLKEWDPIRRSGYAQEFLQLEGPEALGRILLGLSMQASTLSKKPPSDAHSNEMTAILSGMHSIWHAQLNNINAPSISALLVKIDPNAAAAVSSALATAQTQANAKDAALPATLQTLALAIANAGTRLGAAIIID